MGFVAAAPSAHKLDLLCAALIGLSRSDVPTLEAAFERELIPSSVEELEISGNWRDYITPEFHRIQAQSSLLFRGSGGLWGNLRGAIIQKALCPRPQVLPDLCIGCGKCREICPAKAITLPNGKPVIDRTRCIRCFCCQEFCPKGAMEQHRPVIARLLSR